MDNVDKSAVTDILKKAKALISREHKWIKGVSASSRKSNAKLIGLPFQSRHATCFCATGAVRRAAFDTYEVKGGSWWRECDTALKAIDKALYLTNKYAPSVETNKYAPSVESYNDMTRTTHADIMNLFDRAIALSEADEGKERE